MRRAPQRDVTSPRPIAPPAKTPRERENQLASYAYDLAERQILDGTASAQVITHFLKAASSREVLEQQRLENENILLVAKAEAMASVQHIEALYVEAMNAMRGYSGQPPLDSGVNEDEFFDGD